MKRSEAIQKIFEVMKTYEDCYIGHAAAENILHHIEQMGMRPPTATVQDPGQFPGDNFEYDIDTWEEE